MCCDKSNKRLEKYKVLYNKTFRTEKVVTLFSLELLLNGVITVPDPMTFINGCDIISFGLTRKSDKLIHTEENIF